MRVDVPAALEARQQRLAPRLDAEDLTAAQQLGVAGQPVGSLADFYRKLWAVGGPGDPVPLTLLKGSRMEELSVTASDRYTWLRLQQPVNR